MLVCMVQYDSYFFVHTKINSIKLEIACLYFIRTA